MQPLFSNLLEPRNNVSETAFLLIRLFNIKISRSSLKQEIEEHPDYPSLLSISDTLQFYGIENITAAFDHDRLTHIPTPFITQVKNKKNGTQLFTVVKEASDETVTYFDADKQAWRNVTTTQFLASYSGIALMADLNAMVEEKDYHQKIRAERNNRFITYIAASLLPFIVLTAGIFSSMQAGKVSLLPFIFCLLTLSGGLFSILLVWYEIDQHNPALQKVCSFSKKASCGAVLKSNGAQVAGISWSIIGFAYFAGSLIALLSTGMHYPPMLGALSWISIATVPYIGYSLYYQWQIVKRWCMLCLSVQAVLALQFLVAVTAGWYNHLSIPDINTTLLMQISIAFSIPVLLSVSMLPLIRKAKDSQNNKAALQRLKRHPAVFESLLQRQKKIVRSTENLGITIGNPNPKYKIIKVCNLYCRPCAMAHPVIEELLEKNPDIQLQIIFTATNREGNIATAPAKHLLAISEKKNEVNIRQALNDWYLPGKKDYKVFAEKYPMNGELQKQAEKINGMSHWCQEMEIDSTPCFFINGYQLPSTYDITDLKYFLSV